MGGRERENSGQHWTLKEAKQREWEREKPFEKKQKLYNAAVCSQLHSCLHKTDQSVSDSGPGMGLHSKCMQSLTVSEPWRAPLIPAAQSASISAPRTESLLQLLQSNHDTYATVHLIRELFAQLPQFVMCVKHTKCFSTHNECRFCCTAGGW